MENYIATRTYLEATNTSSSSAKQFYDIQYFDGLGRPKQVVNVKASPQGKDIVTYFEYDQLGRQTKNYLPVPQAGSENGAIYASPLGNASSIYGGEKIFSESILEKSPLERIEQQVQVGNDWAGKPVQFNYNTNVSGEVKKYVTSTTWADEATLSSVSLSGSYGAAQLYKNTVTDEDGNKVIEFKNGRGQLVLQRRMANTSENSDLYYVYNEYDQLAFVISPLASVAPSLDQSVLDNLCYQYRYDKKNRLVEKKIPGKGWEYMVYDKADRLILTQDTNLKLKNQWIVTKYDQYGRSVYKGIVTGGTRNSRQNEIKDSVITESRNTTGFTRSGMAVYYTENYFAGATPTILSVHYYDTYPQGAPVVPGQILGQDILPQAGPGTSLSTKGVTLASYIKNIEDDHWTKSYNYYDKKGRVIGTYSINHLGGYTRIESQLDFAGALQMSVTKHKRTDSDTEKIIKETFDYDHQNRLLAHKHQVDNNPVEILVQNTYNELSQLTNKKVGNNIQSINYAYNIRGWMTKINDPVNLNGKLFGFALKYQNPVNTSFGKYNGNIAEIDWKTSQDGVLKRYNYQYDGQNRLLKGGYSEPGATVEQNGYFNEELSYDLNGNINTLKRYTRPSIGVTAELIDNLKYNYESSHWSNRLEQVTVADGAPDNPSGYYVQGHKILYDGNGNITEMKDKGRSRIDYNFLNLPNFFDGEGYDYAKYLYTAEGAKVKKTEWVVFGNKTTETDYLDDFQYVNGSLKFVPTSEGYYDFERGIYVYHYTDHLGNIRLSYTRKPGSLTIEILGESNYYPFGLKHSGYLSKNPAYLYEYNGKEYQGLAGMYDYGARFYMADLGRWGVSDPLSELQFAYTPYSYVYGNPIRFNDPTGMIGQDPPTRGFTIENPIEIDAIVLTPKASSSSLSFMGIYNLNAYYASQDRLAAAIRSSKAALATEKFERNLSQGIITFGMGGSNLFASAGWAALETWADYQEPEEQKAIKIVQLAMIGLQVKHGNLKSFEKLTDGMYAGEQYYMYSVNSLSNSGTYTKSISTLISSDKTSSLSALLKTMNNEAKSAGAQKLVIEGTAIVNTKLFNPKLAQKLGFSYEKISESSIRLIQSVK
ncbi:sugar-binding protein [Chryseobacterium sp. PMSZPI]|nr:sugar-binding protein [Chryseobacterium sp. PMSZPI]